MTRRLLLTCGMLSSLLYAGATILGAMQWNGYDWTSREVSELFALDAPSRPIVATAFLAYGVLVIAFGVGVFLSAGSRRALRITGILLIGYGIVGEPGPIFFSMHTMVRGGGVQGMQLSDVLHAIITLTLILLILLSIGIAATGLGRRFRLYSIGTILLIIVFGALAGLQSGRLAANQPTPWMGVEERINIASLLLWILVLAICLLRAQRSAGQADDRRGELPRTTARDLIRH